MFNYEKRLQYPVNIRRTDAHMAKAIITQFGGPDGETGASMRYLSQRFAMPYREVMGILTDIGTEAPEGNKKETDRKTKERDNLTFKNKRKLNLLLMSVYCYTFFHEKTFSAFGRRIIKRGERQ